MSFGGMEPDEKGESSFKTESPKIFMFNLNVGSGIERAGNLFLRLLREKFDVYEYKHQNPGCVTIEYLVKQKPQVIVINEYFDRVFESCFYYKALRPNTKLILINHCISRLQNMPLAVSKRNGQIHDREVLINYTFRKIDHIINLNHHPERIVYPKFLKNKIIDRLFPIDPKFRPIVAWKDRKKDFFAYGNICDLKFSKEFIKRCDVEIDVYGRMTDEYKKEVEQNKHLHLSGFIPEEKLVDVINEYKFLIVPHSGREPFNLCIAEAIRCGCIPLLTNKRDRSESDWIDWAEGCYIEYKKVEEMLKGIHRYLENKERITPMLDARSSENAKTMTSRTDHESFGKLLRSLIQV